MKQALAIISIQFYIHKIDYLKLYEISKELYKFVIVNPYWMDTKLLHR